jgi:hypothetical protein
MVRISRYIQDGKWLKSGNSNDESIRNAVRDHARECETEELLKIRDKLKEKGLEFELKDSYGMVLVRAGAREQEASIRFGTKKGSLFAENLMLFVCGDYSAKVDTFRKSYKFDFVKCEASAKFYDSTVFRLSEIDSAKAIAKTKMDAESSTLDKLKKIVSGAGYEFVKFSGTNTISISMGTEKIMFKVQGSTIHATVKIGAQVDDVPTLIGVIQFLIKEKKLSKMYS